MKKILKSVYNILQIILKSVLALFIVFSCYSYLNQVFYNEEVYTASDYKSYPEDIIDVLVLGSSHAQYSFVPAFFYEETGLYSYILGSSCQPLKVSYQMLKEGLKTQSPKLVILEVYTSMPLKSVCADDSCYVRAEYEMSGEEKYTTISYLPEEKAETYYNDFLNYHNNWRELASLDKLLTPLQKDNSEDKIIESSFGYVYNEPAWNYKNFWYPNQFGYVEPATLEKEDEEALNSILQLCKENDISLILYKSPMDGIDEENQSYLEGVWKWANENEVPHIDFNQNAALYTYFMNVHSDSYHAYINGAFIITEKLMELVNQLNIPFDHKANDTMDANYNKNAQYYTSRYLKYEVNPFIYLNRYINSSGYVIVRYTSSDVLPEENLQYALKQIVGNREEFNHDLFAVVHNGEIVTILQTPYDVTIDDHVLHLDQTGVYMDGYSIGQEGPLSLTFLNDQLTEWTTNNIEYRGYTWTWGYHYYTKD